MSDRIRSTRSGRGGVPQGEGCCNHLPGPRQDRLPAANDDRTLHQFRVCKQDRDDRLGGRVVGLVEPQFLKAFVLAHQIRGRVGQEPQKPLKIGLTQRIFQIFGNVDLDAALLQNFERCAGLASAGVVVHLKFCHACFPPPRNIPGPGPVAKPSYYLMPQMLATASCGAVGASCDLPRKDRFQECLTTGNRDAVLTDPYVLGAARTLKEPGTLIVGQAGELAMAGVAGTACRCCDLRARRYIGWKLPIGDRLAYDGVVIVFEVPTDGPGVFFNAFHINERYTCPVARIPEA